MLSATLDFWRSGPYPPIVIYNHFRTLVSLLIVLSLAVVFLWGGSRVLNSMTGAAAPAPTATPKPAIEQPTIVSVKRRASDTLREIGYRQSAHLEAVVDDSPAIERRMTCSSQFSIQNLMS